MVILLCYTSAFSEVIYADFYAKILDWNFRLIDENSGILVVVFVSKLNFSFSFCFVDGNYRNFVVVIVFMTKINLLSSTKIFVFVVVDKKNTDRHEYTITQDNRTYILHETVEERDLGIIVTDSLSASTQCAEAAKKAMRILGMVRRQFKDMDKECFTLMYRTFIRPYLEYAIQVWSPYKRRDIDCLEKVQRRATKLVKGLKNCRHELRLTKLGLTTLEEKRRTGDLIEAYKIITGKEKVRVQDFFNFHHSSYDLWGHCYKLATKRSGLELRRNFFSQRVVSLWNRLPSHVVEATTVNTFKNRLDRLKKGTP